jgi:hypothetical protein
VFLQAEVGEIGIRELGESLLAIERTVLWQAAQKEQGATEKNVASNRTRLDALAAPAGTARVVAPVEGPRMAQKPKTKSVDALPLPPEARVITAGGRGKKGYADGEAVGLGHGSNGKLRKVVAVVKPLAKRWCSLLGAYRR